MTTTNPAAWFTPAGISQGLSSISRSPDSRSIYRPEPRIREQSGHQSSVLRQQTAMPTDLQENSSSADRVTCRDLDQVRHCDVVL